MHMNDLQAERIATCMRDEYGLRAVQVTFLPLGADRNTTVYRVMADDGAPYFLKLRSGIFDETSVALPRFLSDQGVAQIIAPLTNKTGQPWARLNAFTAMHTDVERGQGRTIRGAFHEAEHDRRSGDPKPDGQWSQGSFQAFHACKRWLSTRAIGATN